MFIRMASGCVRSAKRNAWDFDACSLVFPPIKIDGDTPRDRPWRRAVIITLIGVFIVCVGTIAWCIWRHFTYFDTPVQPRRPVLRIIPKDDNTETRRKAG